MAVFVGGNPGIVSVGTTNTSVIKFETSAGVENAVAARAWCNANTVGTYSIRRSFNVDQIVDAGVGLYNVNFLYNFTSATSYSITCSSNNANSENVQFVGPDPTVNGTPALSATFEAGAVALISRGTGGNNNDAEVFCLLAVGT